MLKQWIDQIFGYDFFISYAHADGLHYPQQLVALLKKRRLSAFLDKYGYVAGDELPKATVRFIRASSKLVVVARPQALTSNWVAREVETCLEADRTPIVIDVNRCFAGAPDSERIRQLCKDRIYIEEALSDPDGDPTPEVIEELARGFHATRRQTIRVWSLAFGLAVLAIVAVTAIWQFRNAKVRGDIAISRELAATAISQLTTDPELGMLLAVEAMRTRQTVQAENALRRSLAASRIRQTLKGHAKGVNGLVFNPDGSRLITVSDDHTAQLWNMQTGARLAVLRGHTRPVRRAMFLGRGDQVLTTSADGTSIVWEADSEKALVSLANAAYGDAQGLEPGEALIVDVDAHGVGRLLDAVSGREVGVPMEYQKILLGGHRSPDGRLVVVPLALSAVDHRLQVWDAQAGTRMTETRQDSGAVHAVAFSPGGDLLVTALGDAFTGYGYNRVDVWETRTWKRVAQLHGHLEDVLDASFSPDGRYVVTASTDGRAMLWRTGDWQLVEILRGHAGAVVKAAFSPDSKLVATAGEDGTARLWEAETGRESALLTGHTGKLQALLFSPDGAVVVTADSEGAARVWASQFGERMASIPKTTRGALSHNGRRLVTTGAEILVWNTSDWRRVAQLPQPRGADCSVAFSRDDRRMILATSWYDTASLWDTDTWRQVAHLGLEGDLIAPNRGSGLEPVSALAFSPDGSLLATPARHAAARVWDARTGRLVAQVGEKSNASLYAAFSPSGRVLATYSDPVRLWRVGSWEEIAHLRGEGREWLFGWRSVDFSPDGKRLLTAVKKQRAHVWDADTGRRIADLRGHTSVVWTAAFSPDSRWVATGSDDRTARLWEAETGEALSVLRGHEDSLRSVAFSRGGRCLVTSSDDRTVRVWDLDTGRDLAVLWAHSMPVLSADGTILVAHAENGLVVYSLGLCGSTRDLLNEVAKRAARDLTPEERERF